MKVNSKIALLLTSCLAVTTLSSFRTVDRHVLGSLEKDDDLYHTIVKMDSIYFTAYNNCEMETQARIYAEDLEFYHDKGGLSTSKNDILKSIETNICGKVSRELVKGSIEVYPIYEYGAVEIGMHRFYNNQEPDAPALPSKFITIWKREGEFWKISRVISLHK